MYYEINVALNGNHFFATSERSITRESKMLDVLTTILEKFPKSEGYDVTVTKWEKIGQPIKIVNVGGECYDNQ